MGVLLGGMVRPAEVLQRRRIVRAAAARAGTTRRVPILDVRATRGLRDAALPPRRMPGGSLIRAEEAPGHPRPAPHPVRGGRHPSSHAGAAREAAQLGLRGLAWRPRRARSRAAHRATSRTAASAPIRPPPHLLRHTGKNQSTEGKTFRDNDLGTHRRPPRHEKQADRSYRRCRNGSGVSTGASSSRPYCCSHCVSKTNVTD